MLKGLFFLVIGVIITIYMLLFHDKKRKKCTQRTIGRIVECLKTADNEHGDAAMDYYIVEYEVAGKVYKNETGCEIAKARAIGDDMELFYEPDNPANCFFTIDNDGKRFLKVTLWSFSLLMFATAAFCFLK
ncbi:MAG: DUF3592 domain-containing protein [Phascolarctobacterium sp.]|nr:DUF3592 domain-containing protein [Phascolarctobacterium sp.]